MNGSEWFGTLAGGLNRYFESLFLSLRDLPELEVDGRSFGRPAPGGVSWGPLEGGTAKRFISSRLDAGRRPDVVDTHFALYGRRRFPLSPESLRVHHFQGPWFQESAAAGAGRLSTLAKFHFEKAVYGSADHFVVLSPRFADLLSDTFDVDGARITTLSPGVDLTRFSLEASRDGGASSQNVVCVRRLEKRMGIDVLLTAWPYVLDRYPHARLDIVGTGSEGPALRSLAGRLGLDGSVSFRGKLSEADLVQAYRSAVLSVVPSTALEGFGLIALESMAVGTPVIVTDCGGLPEAVRDLDESLIVPPGQPRALSTRVIAALAGRLPTPEATREHAETFSWRGVAIKHHELYKTLLSARGEASRRHL